MGGGKNVFKEILEVTKRVLNKKQKPEDGGLYSEYVANIGTDAAKIDISEVEVGNYKTLKPKSAWYKVRGITNLFWPQKRKLNYDVIRKGQTKNKFSKNMPAGFEDGKGWEEELKEEEGRKIQGRWWKRRQEE